MEVWWPPIKVYFTPFKNMTLRVFEAFAGVGSQRMALRNLNVEHEVVAIAEIDKFAIKSYEAIHGKVFNLGDISKIKTEEIPDHDLFTYSFPCQDISVAGQGLGLDEGGGTRSGLLWECQKVIAGKKPKYLLLENVKNLVGKKHKPNFDKWLSWLKKQGYTNYWQVLNAKDYGVPQNRERVFVVSILGEHQPYEFPKPIKLDLRLKDVLEKDVEDKFYLSEEIQNRLTINLKNNTDIHTIGSTKGKENTRLGQRDVVYSDTGIMGALSATDYKQPKHIGEPTIKQVAQYDTPTRTNSNRFRTYHIEGLAPTLGTMGGGGREPHIPIKNATKKGYIKAKDGDGVDLAYPDSKTRRGRVQKDMSQTLDTSDNKGVVIAASRGRNPKNPSDRTVGVSVDQRLEINKQGTSNTITTVQKDNYVLEGVDVHPFSKKLEFQGYKQKEVSPCLLATDYKAPKTIIESKLNDLRIRKLTPLECWRLMGFSDDDFYKAEAVNSNTQLYKQAGNSIVVNLLEAIFSKLFKTEEVSE